MINNLVSSRHPVLSRPSALHIRLHSSLKEGIVLFEAVYVKFNAEFLLVFHAEVEPLAMTVRIGVYSHVKVIFEL